MIPPHPETAGHLEGTAVVDEELTEEFEEEPVEGVTEVLADDLDEPDLDEEFGEDDVAEDVAEDLDAEVVDAEDEVEEAAVPARRKVAAEEEEDDEDEADPDDVEEDLDTILKDRIASGDDLEDEEEEEVPDRNDPDAADGVAAKKAGEFTCPGCFMIMHPRQFGRLDAMICPEGYAPCPAMAIVRSMK